VHRSACRLLGPLTALLLASCASQEGYRRLAQVCDRAPGADCGAYSVERAVGERAIVNGREGTFDYLLGFVEFDDHGALVRPEQLEELFRTLDEEGQGRDLAIVVYVHGWKHNASPRDPDVENFRDLLRRLHLAEQAGDRKRKVVGVYAGWPGSSVLGHNPASETLKTLGTFWSRMDAAGRVAAGQIQTLFARLQKLQEDRNARGGDTRLVTIGHSFGGLVAFSALKPYLVANAARSAGDEPVAGYGDLVVLLNPAFEGVRYDPIQSVVASRQRYAKGQPPILITFSSESDWPNRYAFPFGRYLSVVTQLEWPRDADQAPEVVRAVGFVDRFRTHTLSVPPDGRTEERARELSLPAERERQASQSRARGGFEAEYCDEDGKPREGWERRHGDGAVLKHLTHAGEKGYAPDNPFWVVSTDPAILPGHNAIWRPQFLEFLYQLYTDLVRPERDLCGAPASRPRLAAGQAG
jgi:hypothetical protein